MTGRPQRAPVKVRVAMPPFLAGDVILFASTGDMFSSLSRWLMRGPHEGPTYAVHSGQFLDARRVLEMEGTAQILTLNEVINRRYWQGPLRGLMPPPAWARLDEALNRRFPRYRRLARGLWQRRGFEVWRCRTLTDEQRAALTREALQYAHVPFGFGKLGAHLLDDLLSKLLRRDVFLFRRADPEDHRPVCSGITAAVYDRALHYRFGLEPEAVDPDQIHDWVRAHPAEWECVFRREPEWPPAPARPVLQPAG